MPGIPISNNYLVRYDDIDFTNKAFLPSIINYFTDLATFQASKIGLDVDTLKSIHRGWVLCQWDIDIFRLPTFSETISVTTIPYSYKKFFAYRVFQIKDSKNDILVEGKSSWMYLDLEKRRPIRLSYDDLKPFGVKEGDNEVIDVIKPIKLNSPSKECSFDVRYTDIDTNNHVNNSRYLTWALETLDIEFLKYHIPKNVKILYSKEKRYGGNITSSLETINLEDNIKTLHHIVCENNTHLCDIEILWN